MQISHEKASHYSLPIILFQIIVLMVFSIFDPTKSLDIIKITNVDAVHQVICAHDTKAFLVVEVVFEGSILLIGFVLEFKNRNLEDEFGEAKQIILSMYNIAVVCSAVVAVTNFIINGKAHSCLLYAVGIFWVMVFSSCVFVIP